MNEHNGRKTLVRSTNGRMAAGVCAGVADYFGIDVTLVRVMLAIAAVLTGGTGILAYLAAWVIIPAEGQKNSVAENIISKSQHV
jgi:phage shock protein C